MSESASEGVLSWRYPLEEQLCSLGCVTGRITSSSPWTGGTTRSRVSSKGSYPQRRSRQGLPSPCVTKPMADGHGQVGNDNPSGCECYVGDQRFCRGASSRLVLATIKVAPWYGTANTHCFGIFNAT